VRLAREDDVPRLAALVRENNEDRGAALYADDLVRRDHVGATRQVTTLVAEDGDALVGYATLNPYYNSDDARPGYWLDELYVAPARRGEGIGGALMRAIREHAKEVGRPSVWWGVERTNTRAIAFYDRLGAVDYKATIYRLDA